VDADAGIGAIEEVGIAVVVQVGEANGPVVVAIVADAVIARPVGTDVGRPLLNPAARTICNMAMDAAVAPIAKIRNPIGVDVRVIDGAMVVGIVADAVAGPTVCANRAGTGETALIKIPAAWARRVRSQAILA